MGRYWFSFLYWALRVLRFDRIDVLGVRPDPEAPTLYLASHRNGAIDGAVYLKAVPWARLTMAARLRKGRIGRAIFSGIEFVRGKDRAEVGAGGGNAGSFAECVAELARGGSLLFFPEGTSDLGPKRLPIQPGTAKLVAEALKSLPVLRLQAVAAHYEDAPRLQSRVEIRVGTPVEVKAADRLGRAEILALVGRLFDEVVLDCETAQERSEAEAMAAAAAVGGAAPYSTALLALGKARGAEAEALRADWRSASNAAKLRGLRMFQGVGLFPVKWAPAYFVYALVLGAFAAGAAAANAPALWAVKKAEADFADAPNTKALWGSLALFFVGVPWAAAVGGGLWACAGWQAAAAYLLATATALKTRRRLRKLACCCANAPRMSAEEKSAALALQGRLVKACG